MANTIPGLDVSGWQHPNNEPIDWPEVHKAGYRFVIIKSTQALDYHNPWLCEDAWGAHDAGLLIGTYHYAVPGDGDAAAQAAYALASAAKLPLNLGISLDIEEPGTLQMYQVGDWCQEFMTAIRNGHHYSPIYTYHDFGAQLVGIPWGQRLWWADDLPLPGTHPYMTQGAVLTVPGIPAPVDTDTLVMARSVTPLDNGGPKNPTVPCPDPARSAEPSAVTGIPSFAVPAPELLPPVTGEDVPSSTPTTAP